MIVPISAEVAMEELDTTTSERLGHAVRRRRRHLGLSQRDLADLAGASPRFIGALENGKSTVRVDKLIDVLDALGLELVTELKSVT